ncbi:MAG: FKBP-type peptidyl-prolyl cis-trans isomerase [Bacteroidales bacterium]|nr:FKBP-type peptidyl-prolyl cis-trans isomerase [Bacteroidales bacterium]
MACSKIIAALTLCVVLVVSCSKSDNNAPAPITKDDLINHNRMLARYDSALIVDYSDTAQLNTVPTDGGLWITVRQEGSGAVLNYGDEVTLRYRVSTLLGKVYYSSERDGLKHFVVGSADEPSGLSEALITMRRGASATLILIPDKAFGLVGDENRIRGRQILRYDFEVLENE